MTRLIVLLLIAIGVGLALNVIRKNTLGTGFGNPLKGVGGKFWTWGEKLWEIAKKAKGRWLYPVYIYIPYFILTWWMCSNFFPNAWHWMWDEQRTLYWTVPAIILASVWTVSFDHVVPKIIAYAFLALLGLAIYDRVPWESSRFHWSLSSEMVATTHASPPSTPVGGVIEAAPETEAVWKEIPFQNGYRLHFQSITPMVTTYWGRVDGGKPIKLDDIDKKHLGSGRLEVLSMSDSVTRIKYWYTPL